MYNLVQGMDVAWVGIAHGEGSFFEMSNSWTLNHPMKPKQMPRLSLIVHAENQRIALVGEQNFDGVVRVAFFGKQLELCATGLFEQLEFGNGFGQRHLGVAFIQQKLLEHVVCISQTRTRKRGAIFPAIASAAEVIAASFRELLAHRHMRLQRGGVISGGKGGFFFPFFRETKFIVLQQCGSILGKSTFFFEIVCKCGVFKTNSDELVIWLFVDLVIRAPKLDHSNPKSPNPRIPNFDSFFLQPRLSLLSDLVFRRHSTGLFIIGQSSIEIAQFFGGHPPVIIGFYKNRIHFGCNIEVVKSF